MGATVPDEPVATRDIRPHAFEIAARGARPAGMSAVLTHPEITPQRQDCVAEVGGLELRNVVPKISL
jgi:hypothetical protein